MIHLLHPRLPEVLIVWTATALWIVHNYRRRRKAPLPIAKRTAASSTTRSRLASAAKGPLQITIELSSGKLELFHKLLIERGLQLEESDGEDNAYSSLLYDVARQVKAGIGQRKAS